MPKSLNQRRHTIDDTRSWRRKRKASKRGKKLRIETKIIFFWSKTLLLFSAEKLII